MRRRDRLVLWLVRRLPRLVVYWAFMRVAAHATTGEHGREGPSEVSLMASLRRWEGTPRDEPATDNPLAGLIAGRLVHFVYGDAHYAAVVTATHSRLMDADEHMQEGQTLMVFPPMEHPFATVATFDPALTPATWHWIERA